LRRAQDGEQPRKEISFINVGFPHHQDEWYLSKMFPGATPLLDRGVNVPHPPISLFRVPGTSLFHPNPTSLVIYSAVAGSQCDAVAGSFGHAVAECSSVAGALRCSRRHSPALRSLSLIIRDTMHMCDA
jgi:hypothetical protein